jgi:hypothetical protein
MYVQKITKQVTQAAAINASAQSIIFQPLYEQSLSVDA